ncbi:MAG: hypothetical protein J0L93_10065 [Deltaproteobacteria bacterium]|nr:hypothetical protein [Deltaproteobacteria bacterium]
MRKIILVLTILILSQFFDRSSFLSAKDLVDYAAEMKQPKFKGSLALTFSQRFFDDERLSYVNGFSKWGNFSFDAIFGLYEFDFGLEPLLGFGFIKNTAYLYALDNGVMTQSEDKFSYNIYTTSLGARYKPWGPEKFFLMPYVQSLFDYRFVNVRKYTYNATQQKTNNGGDLGFQFGGGLICSFMYGDRRHDLNSTWDLKDFGLITSTRYFLSGLARHGLGEIKDTGGWDFGLGLFLDW